MNEDLSSYYHQRAKEYDKVYLNPAEQEDLLAASLLFQDMLATQSVLEIACGTGYWTEQISKTAASILATDINQSLIDVAKHRQFHSEVVFEEADMYRLKVARPYDAVFGGFIWSHILIEELDGWLEHLSSQVSPGGRLVFIDSKQVDLTSHDKRLIARRDEKGNTWQTRTLQDGSCHLVLKNYPTKEFLSQTLSRVGTDINVVHLKHYWIASCRVKEDGSP